MIERLRNLIFTATYNSPRLHNALRSSSFLRWLKRLNSAGTFDAEVDMTELKRRFVDDDWR